MKMLLLYVESVKRFDQPKIHVDRLQNNDARLILRRKFNQATT